MNTLKQFVSENWRAICIIGAVAFVLVQLSGKC